MLGTRFGGVGTRYLWL